MNVYLARHGETTWNVAGRYQGRRESALTSLGMAQAAALAAAMRDANVGRVIASPMLRTTATALPVADALGLALETDDRLIEIAHGTWEGRLREEIEVDDAARYHAWRTIPPASNSSAARRWRRSASAGAVENGAYAVFDVDHGRWTLVEECVRAHLGDLRAAAEFQAL